MRFQAIAPFCCIAALGLASSACSLLGTYANSASSMMTQPGATGATPATAGAPGSTSATNTPTAGSEAKSAAKAPSEPTTVSVTLRNSCSKTVKVFFGDKPKFGSGRYSSLSSNSRTNQTFKPGDQLWIVDDGQNGVESVKVEAGMKEIEVASSCDAFHTH
jgi:hypothetical protein